MSSLKLGELRFPSASRLSLTDPAGVVESAGAYVHFDLNQSVEAAESRLRLRPHVDGQGKLVLRTTHQPVKVADARLLASPILQEYDAFTTGHYSRQRTSLPDLTL